MPLRICFYCRTNSNTLYRFLDNGIKYKCNTKKCNDFIEAQQDDKRRKAREKIEREEREKKRKWDEMEEYYDNTFIKASKQSDDCYMRYIDPLKWVTLKRLYTNVWEETYDNLTDADIKNIMTFNDNKKKI